MKTIIIYKSKTGFTETYAKWLQEALDCDIIEHKNAGSVELIEYDIIIFGGGIYAGKIAGIDLIKQNYDILRNKEFIVWATGQMPGSDDALAKLWQDNLPDEIRKNVKTFYLRGGFDYSKLGFGSKIIMKGFKGAMAKSEDPDMRGFAKDFYKPQDYRDEEYIKPLIDHIGILSK